MGLMATASAAAEARMDLFLERYCSQQIDPDGTPTDTWNIPPSQYGHYSRLRRQVEHTRNGVKLIPRSLTVSLVSQFDAYMSSLLRAIFVHRPQLISHSDRTFTFAQILELGSIDAARELLLEKEIESVLRQSHVEQFEWMERKFDVALRKDLEAWPIFVELTERRNLFVHTDGVVSSQYLSACQRHKVSIPPETIHGSVLGATRDYIISAHKAVLEIGIKLAQVLWRKVLVDEGEDADRSLNDSMYWALLTGRYDLAARWGEFASKYIKKYHSEESRLTIIINNAIAHKWSGDDSKCKFVLNAHDWSACNDRFKLAIAVLLEEYGKAADAMRRIGTSRVISEDDYREWPLFRRFRATNEFQVAFESVFDKKFQASFDRAPALAAAALEGEMTEEERFGKQVLVAAASILDSLDGWQGAAVEGGGDMDAPEVS